MIRVGTAGWHYEDWNGVVYPKPRPHGFDPLAMLSGLFDTLEVNVTFYRVPDPSMTASWAARVAANPRFRFTVKAPRLFTHEAAPPAPDGVPAGGAGEGGRAVPGAIADAEESRFRRALEPLLDAGLLGAVLIQFPQSFHHTPRAQARLEDLLDRFSDLPCVVEFRHAGWGDEETVSLLRRRRAGFCNIDQPRLASTLRPTAFVTAPVAYVRLHGRNAAHWFEAMAPASGISWAAGSAHEQAPQGTGTTAREPGGQQRRKEPAQSAVARRYDYLYSPDELAPWLDTVRRIAEQGADGYVIANNHFRGKAAVNALQIKAALEDTKVEVPASLLDAYPELGPIAKPIPGRLPFE